MFSSAVEKEQLQVGVRDDVEEDVNKKNKMISYSGLHSLSLRTRLLNGTAHGASDIRLAYRVLMHQHEASRRVRGYPLWRCGQYFPHHTNEIAQSESYLGHDWCKYWFHVNHLNDRAGKMSKSKGAILTVSVLQEKGYNPLAYRFFCLQSHYRKPLEFSFDALDNAVAAYNKIAKRVAELKDEGDIDETAFADFKKKFTDAVSMI